MKMPINYDLKSGDIIIHAVTKRVYQVTVTHPDSFTTNTGANFKYSEQQEWKRIDTGLNERDFYFWFIVDEVRGECYYTFTHISSPIPSNSTKISMLQYFRATVR